MDLDAIRKYCLSLPGAAEDIKWGNDLAFTVGVKMFCVTSVDSSDAGITLKASAEEFVELIERDGVKPAAYVGRYNWLHIDTPATFKREELKGLIRRSYDLVFAKLPAKVRRGLAE